MNGPDTLHHGEHNTMQRIPLVCLFALVISGCSEGEPPVPDSSKAPVPVSEPGLPMISEELLEGSVAMDLMAVTRRLDEITGSYATKKAIQPPESEGMQQDLERLQKAKPLENEVALLEKCVAVLKEVQTWGTADQKVDVHPIRKRIKALKVALRIDHNDSHNEPLMNAVIHIEMLIIEPSAPDAVQKLDHADELAAKPNTDKDAAKLTQDLLATVRQLVTKPDKELQKEAIELATNTTWKLRMDTYRRVQLYRESRPAPGFFRPFGGRRRLGL